MRTTISLLLILLAGALYAQQSPPSEKPVLSLYEESKYDPGKPAGHVLGNNAIVEINGNLIARFDKNAIRERMMAYADVDSADMRLITKYKIILETKIALLEQLERGRAANQGKADFKALNELSKAMSNFLEVVISEPVLLEEADKAIKEYRQLRARGQINSALYTEDYYLVEYLSRAAAASLQRIEQAGSVKFMLTGTLIPENGKSRAVHIGGDFDDYPEEIYVAPRWVFSLSEEQKKELQAVSVLANRFELLRGKNITQIKDAFYQATSSRICLEGIKIQFANLQANLKALNDTVSNKAMAAFKPLQDQLIRVENAYIKVPEGAQQISGSADLLGFASDLSSARRESEQFFTTLPARFDSLVKSIGNAPQIKAVLLLKDSCQLFFKSDYARYDTLYQALKSLFVGSEADKNLQQVIGDKVRQLSIGQIPEETSIDLIQIGRRGNGDRLQIQAFVQMDGAPTSNKPARIYYNQLYLQQIALYSEVKVNMILANPEPDLALQRREYTFAPSYSVLFRWGSRKSRFYNEFINVGIGANFSAPDFNLDGTPEFGAALTVSTLKDFLSVGYGYNFGVDAPFLFIGFRLPFASAALPIFNNIER